MNNRTKAVLFFCFLLIFSIVYSPFLLTLSIIGLLLLSLFRIEPSVAPSVKTRIVFNKDILRNVIKNKIWLVMMTPFVIVLLSGTYSEDFIYLAERLRIRLPFLVLPIAFANLPRFTKRDFYSIFYFLQLVMVVSLGVTLIKYGLDFENINTQIEHGKSMPTPMNHIRYSLLLAISILSGVVLYGNHFRWKYAWERKVLFAALLFQAIGIHVLSVRSGLAVLYAASAALIFLNVLQTKRYLLGVLYIVGLLALPLVAYFALPSFKAKVDYAFYDRQMRAEGRVKDFSDSERIASLEVGMIVAKQNILFGVGAGDVWHDIKAVYARDYAWETEPKIPHNQFLMIAAGTGLVGVLLFIWSFFYPLWYKQFYKEPIFLAHGICLLLSYFVEPTIEIAVGTSIYMFFASICVHYQLSNLDVEDEK